MDFGRRRMWRRAMCLVEGGWRTAVCLIWGGLAENNDMLDPGRIACTFGEGGSD